MTDYADSGEALDELWSVEGREISDELEATVMALAYILDYWADHPMSYQVQHRYVCYQVAQRYTQKAIADCTARLHIILSHAGSSQTVQVIVCQLVFENEMSDPGAVAVALEGVLYDRRAA